MTKVSVQEKKDLIDRVRSLTDPTEHRQLLRVIIKSRVKFTENTNGCFIDLSKIDDRVINRLYQVVELCEQNREYNEKMNALLEETRKEVDIRYEYKLSRKQVKKKGKKVALEDDEVDSDSEGDEEVEFEEDEDIDEPEDDGNGPDDPDD